MKTSLNRAVLSTLALAVASFPALASDHSQHGDHSGHQGHGDHSSHANHAPAPINVMASHVHGEGEWMFSYRFMNMSMSDNYDGSDKISDEEAHDQGFMVVPKSMDMQMHMFGAMYAPSDKLTLAFMLPYIKNEMELQMRMTMQNDMVMRNTFKTESKGFGDFKVNALYSLFSNADSNAHVNLGLSLPTGSIDQEDETPMSNGNDVQLPYPMQIGSGTYDLMPGITYNQQIGSVGWGSQLSAVIRTGQNDRDYRLGNRYKAQTWASVPVASFVSASVRGSYEQWGNIIGSDDDLNPAMVPTARTDLRAGSRLSAAVGVNFSLPAGNRIALEYEAPLQQDLEGPQLGVDPMLTLGWTKAL